MWNNKAFLKRLILWPPDKAANNYEFRNANVLKLISEEIKIPIQTDKWIKIRLLRSKRQGDRWKNLVKWNNFITTRNPTILESVFLFHSGGERDTLYDDFPFSLQIQLTFSQLSLEQYLGNNPIINRWILARGPLSWICSCPSSSSAVKLASVSPMLHMMPVTSPTSCNEPDVCTVCRSWRMLIKTSTWATTKCKTCN